MKQPQAKNMNILYGQLAKQLSNTKTSGNSLNCTVVKSKDLKNEINKSLCVLKSTKDTSYKNLNNSWVKGKSEIEGPEELHSFYVNIMQQNKGLAFKFENFDSEEAYSNIIN